MSLSWEDWTLKCYTDNEIAKVSSLIRNDKVLEKAQNILSLQQYLLNATIQKLLMLFEKKNFPII